jgi:hypothetical protein
MNKNSAAILGLLALAGVALAQPAEVLQYHERLGGGDLYIQFCFAGTYPCVERRAIAWGQVCDSTLANEIGSGSSGQYEGTVPPGFTYTAFRCGKDHKLHPKTERVFGGGNWMN